VPAGNVDYLLIGHLSRDVTPAGPRLGGTGAFSGLTAHALGLETAIVTSAPEALRDLMSPLAALSIQCIPSAAPTSFENTTTPHGRSQRIISQALPISIADVPSLWRKSVIVHLAPIADEVDPALAHAFSDSLVGVTPQGWMRQWDSAGRVSFKPWLDAPRVLPYAGAVVLSLEDVGGDEALIAELARQTAVLVATRGRHGCTVYLDGQPHSVPAPLVEEVDPTGAGDIFATAFFTRFHATRDALVAARYATAIASDSVTRPGLSGVPYNLPE
jgi:pfkB family carbohydrate kinase